MHQSVVAEADGNAMSDSSKEISQSFSIFNAYENKRDERASVRSNRFVVTTIVKKVRKFANYTKKISFNRF